MINVYILKLLLYRVFYNLERYDTGEEEGEHMGRTHMMKDSERRNRDINSKTQKNFWHMW